MDKTKKPSERPAAPQPGPDDIRRLRDDIRAETGRMEGAKAQKARQPNPGPKTKNV